MAREKLVRDRIPDIIGANGDTFQTRIAGEQEIPELLREKLLEEVHEVLAATDERATIDELADVLEVIHAYAECLGVEMPEIDRARRTKRAARGGFSGGVVLISTGSG
ncbi:hypothetical protein [Actinomadura monticuli]|uniref:Nucleoside triphosphate pyrophosphohydrolase n=1 Tax=Actinomadura monticuli TaxID=3097367 RepID=A0ABV4Q9Z5_9ACTN